MVIIPTGAQACFSPTYFLFFGSKLSNYQEPTETKNTTIGCTTLKTYMLFYFQIKNKRKKKKKKKKNIFQGTILGVSVSSQSSTSTALTPLPSANFFKSDIFLRLSAFDQAALCKGASEKWQLWRWQVNNVQQEWFAAWLYNFNIIHIINSWWSVRLIEGKHWNIFSLTSGDSGVYTPVMPWNSLRTSRARSWVGDWLAVWSHSKNTSRSACIPIKSNKDRTWRCFKPPVKCVCRKDF